MIDKDEIRFERANNIKQERKKKKKYGFIRRNFSKKDYFKSVFPLIRQQKPGIDLYSPLTWT